MMETELKDAAKDSLQSVTEFFGSNAIAIHRVGSRETCNPPPMDTDEDFLALVDARFFSHGASTFDANGYRLDDPNKHYLPEQSTFNSWRGPNSINLIVTADRYWHDKFLLATALAKRFNLLDKADRVALFQAVLYGCTYPPETEEGQ